MKKITALLLVGILMLGFSSGSIFAEVNAVTPSTNDINRTNGWAHVYQLSMGVGTTDLEFISTRSFSSCFEYRTDGDTTQKIDDTNFNTDVTDGLYPYYCQNNNSRTVTINANEYVEIRMVFGAETDERFDWTRFDVESALPTLIDICHKAGSKKWNILSVDDNALPGHFGHGDFLYKGPLPLDVKWCEENAAGVLQGRKYEDTNENGIHDSTTTEPRLSGWTINLYDNNWNSLGSQITQEDPIGQYKFENLPGGTYYLCEEMEDGWKQTGPILGAKPVDLDGIDLGLDAVAVINQSANSSSEGPICWQAESNGIDTMGWLKFGNIENPPLTIIASKIVCDNESDLPNWGNGGPDITSNTASNYVGQHPDCDLVRDWDFEWAYANTNNPGDNLIGPVNGDWNAFNIASPAEIIDLQSSDRIWVREVLKNDYISFSSQTNEPNNDDNIDSAEFYCHTDVLNYDNYDYINAPELGETYYCVGFNVPTKPPVQCIQGENILKNGSFEFPEVTDGKKWQLFDSGTSLLEWVVGWVSDAPSDPPKIEIQEGVLVTASDGDQSVELDSEAPTYISQSVETLPGYEYTLNFDFAARPKTSEEDNKLEIWINGLLEDTISSNTSWETKDYTFVASNSITEIKFADVGIPNDDKMGTFLDNVSLECVGLPQTPACGNGNVEDGEQCDPPSTIISIQDNQFCDKNCQVVPIYNGGNSCPQGTEPEFIKSYSIGAQDIDGEVVPVEEDKIYLFTVSDTFYPTQYGNNKNFLSDAGYTTEDGWTSTSTKYGIQGTPPDYAAHALLGNLGLGVGVINWGDYDSSHEYNFSYTIPTGFTNTQFVIGDRYNDWFGTTWDNQEGMEDNEGSLNLNVYECKRTDPGPQTSTVTICKYNEQRESLEGWNMLLKGDYVEGVSVYPSNVSKNNNEVSASSDLPLDDYLLIASGYYTYRPYTPGAQYSDAGYTKRNCPGDAAYLCSGPFSPWFNAYYINPPHEGYLGIMINDMATNWGSYFNSGHIYATSSTDYSGQFAFTIRDDVYSDNSGELNVDIYKGYSGYTGSDGCVTFYNVPFGNYSLEEILKDGWQNVSGLGQVVIDGTQENFVIINKLPQPLVCDPEIELLQNGGFELPEVTNTKKWDIYPSGTPFLGWFVAWLNGSMQWGDPQNPTQRPTIANLELQAGYSNWLSSEGDQYAELDTDWDGPDGTLSGEPASVSIWQEIPTIMGETYKLTFDFSPRPGLGIDENWLKAFVEGAEVFNQKADGFVTGGQTSWSNNEYRFTAQNNITTIKFEDWGTANSLGTFLDNVSLRCIPEEEPTMYSCNESTWQCEIDEDGQYDLQACEEVCQETTSASSTTTTTTSTTTTILSTAPLGGQYVYSGVVAGEATVRGEEGRGGEEGIVAGASCVPYLYEYIKYGANNNPFEVKKLQAFLNGYLGLNLAVSGIYDLDTYNAVKKFQYMLKDDILSPWVENGCLPSEELATGYVYRTTKWAINNIFCPTPRPDVSDEKCYYGETIGLAENGSVLGESVALAEEGALPEEETPPEEEETPVGSTETTETTISEEETTGGASSQTVFIALLSILVLGGIAYFVFRGKKA